MAVPMKKKLIYAYLALAMRDGYMNVSTVDLAKCCGVTQPLTWYHFGRREVLVRLAFKIALRTGLHRIIAQAWAAGDTILMSLEPTPDQINKALESLKVKA